jgi:hypothetical protein
MIKVFCAAIIILIIVVIKIKKSNKNFGFPVTRKKLEAKRRKEKDGQ